MTERPQAALDLCVVVTTFNNMRTIGRCLESVRGLAARVVTVDSGSTDGTVEHCRESGAEVVHHAWEGYAKQKSFAISLGTTHEWTLLLDSDESIEADLNDGLRAAIRDASDDVAGIEINRKMWYSGGWVNHVAFPDWVLRCGRRGALRMIDRPVHERLEVEGRTVRAHGVCRHDSWDGFADGLDRQLAYARLAAPLRRTPALMKIMPMPVLAGLAGAAAVVVKGLIVQRGLLDGWRGVSIVAVKAIGRVAVSMAAARANASTHEGAHHRQSALGSDSRA